MYTLVCTIHVHSSQFGKAHSLVTFIMFVHHFVYMHIRTLLLLVPFSYKLMHHLKPFAVVVLNGEITVYSVDSPNGFEWQVS